jgi:hypothetical protein
MVQGAIHGRRKVLAAETAHAGFNVIVFRGLAATLSAEKFRKKLNDRISEANSGPTLRYSRPA